MEEQKTKKQRAEKRKGKRCKESKIMRKVQGAGVSIKRRGSIERVIYESKWGEDYEVRRDEKRERGMENRGIGE